MSFCIKCGSALSDGDAFCMNCGAAVAAPAPAPAPVTAPAPAPVTAPAPAPEPASEPASELTQTIRVKPEPQPAPEYTAPEPQPAPVYTAPAPAYAAPEYTAPQPQPVYAPVYQQNNFYAAQPAPAYQAPAYQAPAYQAKTNRSLAKYFWLSLVTFGIYSIVFYSKLSSDCNVIMTRYDGKKTMHYCLVYFIFSWLTLGIVPLVWGSKISSRIGREVNRRGIDYGFGAKTFWLWNILGSLIIVGPFIYMHKLCKAMNYVCRDYNYRG